MSEKINAKFGILEDRIIHLATDEEIKMIRSLVKDITNIRDETKSASLLVWAMAFLSAAFSALVTLLALSAESKNYSLICTLVFSTACLGVFFLWNWYVSKKRETTAIQSKEKQLEEIFQKIEKRVPVN